jgi:ammonium transporter, Amt family
MSEALPIPEEWPEYSVNPQGGDPLTQDLTSPYDKGDLCWILVCTVLCWQISELFVGNRRSHTDQL